MEFTLTHNKMRRYEKDMLLKYAESYEKQGECIKHRNTGSLLLYDLVIENLLK